MRGSWSVQDAKSRFSELLDTTLAEGPQIVTRRGGRDRSTASHRAVAAVGADDEAEFEGVASRT